MKSNVRYFNYVLCFEQIISNPTQTSFSMKKFSHTSSRKSTNILTNIIMSSQVELINIQIIIAKFANREYVKKQLTESKSSKSLLFLSRLLYKYSTISHLIDILGQLAPTTFLLALYLDSFSVNSFLKMGSIAVSLSSNSDSEHAPCMLVDDL